MIVGFIVNDLPRERLLGEAFLAGAMLHGDRGWVVPKSEIETPDAMPDADVFGMCGVKSLEWFAEAHRRQAHALLFDKGYTRAYAKSGPRVWEYWRVALDAHQPTEYLMDRRRSPVRWLALGHPMRPWRRDGDHVLITGSSAKYHRFAGTTAPDEYYGRIARRISKATGRRVIYRPKPTWKEAQPVTHSDYSPPGQPLAEVLEGAWCVVTHGSNAAVDAVLAGIPTVVLGGAVTRPISSTELEDIAAPRLADDTERLRWASALAFCQWRIGELSSGEMWADMRSRILGR